MSRRLALAALLLSLAPPARAPADPGAEFFEKKVRPVLAAHCYECHSAQAAKLRAGLLLDSRGAILAGGESGPAVVPGQPGESRLIRAVRYADPHLRMPPRGKLPDHVVADLEKWVALGAPAPEGEAAAAPRAGSIDLEAGRQFWAFRPPQDHPAPPV
ncbi:MAG TPA: c-type cytochrome domain-containing protein, partial [Gemmataceae bacterium]